MSLNFAPPETAHQPTPTPSAEFLVALTPDQDILLELRQLAEKDANEIAEDQALRLISKARKIGVKVLRNAYAKVKALYILEKNEAAAAATAPSTPEDDQVLKEELRQIDQGVTILKTHHDLLPIFHRLLLQSGYICDEFMATSLFLSHAARLLPTSSAWFFTGASGSGKTDAIVKAAAFLPPESVLSLTSLSDQALHYLGDIKHKVIIFGEMSPRVDEQDDPRQMAMRQLISENKITRMTVEKPDGKSNVAVTKETNGPCVIMATTTKEPNKFNDELQNRASWVQSNDSIEVTQSVLSAIADQAENPIKDDDKSFELCVKAFQEYHRTLEPLPVKIPFAQQIKPTSKHVTVRRLSSLVLNYVRANALVHQHVRQKEIINGRVVVIANLTDYERAYKVLTANAPRVLESCPPKARKVFDEIIRPALLTKNTLTTGQLQQLIKEPDSTVRRWLNDFAKAGLLNCHGKDARQNIYMLNIEVTEHFTQDLGLIAPDRINQPNWSTLK